MLQLLLSSPAPAVSSQQFLLTTLLAFPCLLCSHGPGIRQSSSDHDSSPQSRMLHITQGANIRGDLMIGVPVSFLVPTIGFNTAYKRINKRSGAPSMKSEDRAKKSDPLMSRLDFLFDVLDLREFDCQQRMVCEMVRDRDTFSPLSDLLLSIFSKTENRMLDNRVESSIQHELLSYAAYLGQHSGEEETCRNRFSSCSYHTSQLINTPVLFLWQLASQYLALRIDDT